MVNQNLQFILSLEDLSSPAVASFIKNIEALGVTSKRAFNTLTLEAQKSIIEVSRLTLAAAALDKQLGVIRTKGGALTAASLANVVDQDATVKLAQMANAQALAVKGATERVTASVAAAHATRTEISVIKTLTADMERLAGAYGATGRAGQIAAQARSEAAALNAGLGMRGVGVNPFAPAASASSLAALGAKLEESGAKFERWGTRARQPRIRGGPGFLPAGACR